MGGTESGHKEKRVVGMRQLKLNDTVMPYELFFSSRAKRISARIREGQVKVTVPKGLAVKKAVAFIESAKERIFRLWQKALEEQGQSPIRCYKEGEHLPYLGGVLILSLIKSRRQSIQVQRRDQKLIISRPAQVFDQDDSEMIAGALEHWYRAQAREIFWAKLDQFAALMGVEYRQFRLKDQKTRWGSCSALGNINLNWRVILAPERVVDYLVVHELAHLRYLNHSSYFWRVVEAYLPDYRGLRRWLKEHGRELRI